MTPDVLAARLGCCVQTVRRWCQPTRLSCVESAAIAVGVALSGGRRGGRYYGREGAEAAARSYAAGPVPWLLVHGDTVEGYWCAEDVVAAVGGRDVRIVEVAKVARRVAA